jgi:hypothetical protein
MGEVPCDDPVPIGPTWHRTGRPESIDKRARLGDVRVVSHALSATPAYDEDAAALAALTAAVTKSRASKRGVPHGEAREWLLEIAAGILTPNRRLPAICDCCLA